MTDENKRSNGKWNYLEYFLLMKDSNIKWKLFMKTMKIMPL